MGRRRGFLRAVESLIAIVMVFATFQAFLNWNVEERSTSSARQVGYDVLSAYSESANRLALSDFYSFDQFISYAIPSSLSYKVFGDFFTPVSADPEEIPQTVLVDFPAILNSTDIFVTDLSSEEYPSTVTFNFYRVPFAIQNLGSDLAGAPIYLTVTLPNLDSNEDGTVDIPSASSLDLYVNGARIPFTLHNLQETNGTLIPTLLFNATVGVGGALHGYVYFATGEQDPKPAKPVWTEMNVSGQNIRILTRAVERAPRATITFMPPAERKNVFVVSKIGYPVFPRPRESNLSFQENALLFTLRSENYSVRIDKALGSYQVLNSTGGLVLSGIPEIPGSALAVTVTPHLVNSTRAVGKISANWQVSGASAKIDYSATLFQDGRLLVFRRTRFLEAGSYSPQLDSVSFPRDSALADSWPSPAGTAMKKGLVFSDGISRVGVFPEAQKDFFFNGTLLYPQEPVLISAYSAQNPIESATLFAFGNSLSARERLAGLFGKERSGFDASAITIFTTPTELPFVHEFPQEAPDFVVANFTIRRRFNTTVALSCNLSDKRIFSGLVIPGFASVSEERFVEREFAIPSGFFSPAGANSFFCAVNQTNLTIQSIALEEVYSRLGEDSEAARVTIENWGASDRTFEISLNLRQIGLPEDRGRVFVRNPETSSLERADILGDILSFRALVPAGTTGTRELVFGRGGFSFPGSLAPSEDFPYGGGVPFFPVSPGNNTIAEAYVDFGELLDGGRTYWAPPPDTPTYSDREVSPAADATVSQVFAFDPETGRGGSIKIMLWRKS